MSITNFASNLVNGGVFTDVADLKNRLALAESQVLTLSQALRKAEEANVILKSDKVTLNNEIGQVTSDKDKLSSEFADFTKRVDDTIAGTVRNLTEKDAEIARLTVLTAELEAKIPKRVGGKFVKSKPAVEEKKFIPAHLPKIKAQQDAAAGKPLKKAKKSVTA